MRKFHFTFPKSLIFLVKAICQSVYLHRLPRVTWIQIKSLFTWLVGYLSPEERSGLELVFRIRAFMLSHNALDSAPLNGLSAHTSSPLVLALASHTCPTCSESLQGLLGPLCVFCSCQVVSDSVTLRTVPHQVPLSMGFPRQEYWSGLPFPLLGDLPHPGTESTSALQVDF